MLKLPDILSLCYAISYHLRSHTILYRFRHWAYYTLYNILYILLYDVICHDMTWYFKAFSTLYAITITHTYICAYTRLYVYIYRHTHKLLIVVAILTIIIVTIIYTQAFCFGSCRLSRRTAVYDTFLSHDWGTPRWLKFIAPLLPSSGFGGWFGLPRVFGGVFETCEASGRSFRVLGWSDVSILDHPRHGSGTSRASCALGFRSLWFRVSGNLEALQRDLVQKRVSGLRIRVTRFG